MQDIKCLHPPIEHCPARFLGVTVQPCGEPCGCASGWKRVPHLEGYGFGSGELLQQGRNLS
jgi:hypothetical protein